MRVLLIEDEKDLADGIQRALTEEGYSMDVAYEGETGLFNAETWEYDAIILDLMLPKLDGWALLERLRRTKKTPVLILTARDATTDKIKGLNLGADDYLTKPFSLEELFARLRALIRRAAQEPTPLIQIGDVEIHTAQRRVTKAGQPVTLSAKEYALVEYLALHRNTLVTRTMIYDHIYNEQDDSLSNVVDVYISNIRKKLGSGLVETRRGQGYVVPL